ncbi:uncharacterized protein TNCV_2839401 [Trichonephila clavipes]|nr:uncharacterized protein TNCV_2839401 [Trichonephila clavipes]
MGVIDLHPHTALKANTRNLFEPARDWDDIFGSALVQYKATDFAQLKTALTKNFPVVRIRKDSESQFYASQQKRDPDPTDFIYDQLKVHKKIRLSMPEEALLDHIFVRLEPQVQDYVEVRNRKTTAYLLEVLAKFEERYSYKKMQGSRNSGNVERRGWNESRKSNHDDRQRNWRNSEVLLRPSNSRTNYRGYYESGRQRNQWLESRNDLNRDDRRFDSGYQSGNRVKSENFTREDHRSRGSSTNFSRDKPGITHVLYHEIDTGDKQPVVFRPYRHDRVKQSILDYHIEKILKRGNHNTDSISVRVTDCVV